MSEESPRVAVLRHLSDLIEAERQRWTTYAGPDHLGRHMAAMHTFLDARLAILLLLEDALR